MSFIAPRLPANAPFTPEQRAWIDGFVAGLLSGDAGAAPVLAEPSVVAAPAAGAALPQPPSDPEDFPWHEPGMPMDERLALAAGRPKPRVLMAALAQTDCGQCGYLCRTYAEAIAGGAEPSLTRCVPGGKATSRKLKELVAEFAVEASPAAPAIPAMPATRTVPVANPASALGHTSVTSPLGFTPSSPARCLGCVALRRTLGVRAVWQLAPFGSRRRLGVGAVWNPAPLGTCVVILS